MRHTYEYCLVFTHRQEYLLAHLEHVEHALEAEKWNVTGVTENSLLIKKKRMLASDGTNGDRNDMSVKDDRSRRNDRRGVKEDRSAREGNRTRENNQRSKEHDQQNTAKGELPGNLGNLAVGSPDQ